MPNQNTYERITEQMLRMLDEGTAPWRKPWTTLGIKPTSLSTGKAYRGINHLMLWFVAEEQGYTSPFWGTYKQITERGGQVRKGEKSTTVVLWSQVPDRERKDENGDAVMRWFMKGFNVFNSEQADWQDGTAPVVPELTERSEVDVLAAAEEIVQNYLSNNGPTLTFGGDRAFYRPSSDAVRVPERSQFDGTGEFYSTLFHELGHSTGHESRLNREGVVAEHAFGDAVYSREELVAEFTAAFLCDHVGVLPAVMENSASYIAGWRRALTEDAQAVVWAAGRAQKAADFIIGRDADTE